MKRITAIILTFFCIVPCFSLTSCKSGNISSSFEIVALSCGKADAFVIFTDNSTIIIDCGEKDDGKKISKLLKSRNIQTADYMILSHYDQDHIGGAEKVLKNISISQIYQSPIAKTGNEVYENYCAAAKNSNAKITNVDSITGFSVDGISFTIYPPESSNYKTDESNNSSLCVSIKYKKTSFLFAGDAQDDRLDELVKKNLGKFDFLKVPYHGEYMDSLDSFFKMTKPKYAVITCSDKNKADDKVIDSLAKYNTEVYLTQNGDISVMSDGKSITITQPADLTSSFEETDSINE